MTSNEAGWKEWTLRPANPSPTPASVCEPYHGYIEEELVKGLTAGRIWQDLRIELGFSYECASVKRYVHRLKERRPRWPASWSIPQARKPRWASSRARRLCIPARDAGAGTGYSG